MAKNNPVLHLTQHITTGDSGEPCTIAVVRLGGTKVYPTDTQHRVKRLSQLIRASGWVVVDRLMAGKYGGYIYYSEEPFTQDEYGYKYNGKWDDYGSDDERL